MFILRQRKLMTHNGFGILLILLEKIERDIAKLGKVFNEPPVGLERTNEIDMITKEKNLNEPP